jgi:acetyl-CoA C-acetyltransferase
VVGVSCTRFGDRYDASYGDLAREAFAGVLRDASVEADRIDAAVLATYSPGPHGGKSGASLADAIDLRARPISRVENYCATGTDAFRHAVLAVASGMHECVLALGVEKMKDRPVRGLPLEGRHPVLGRGSSAPGLFALAANRYMHEYGLRRETLARVAVKNHANGALNPLAHMRKNVSLEEVVAAPTIAAPFGVLDCCPTTDGAAAALVMPTVVAKQLGANAVRVRGVGLAVTTAKPFLDPGYGYTGFAATQHAAAQAYDMAGVRHPDREISLAEVHDCFTFTEIANYEDLGFCPKGAGPAFIDEGHSALRGRLPVNPSGGLKSFGHPIGASGLRMIFEITEQLRGRCGSRQVANAELGLAHNLGGPGAVACVVVLGKES